MRRQLPVYSPLPLRALAGALAGRGRQPHTDLEHLLGRRFQASPSRIILLGSGTDALTLALRGLGTVALPGYTCWDVGTAAQGAGVRVRFYDIDPDTLQPDQESLQEAASTGVDALVVSPLFGYPMDWDAIGGLCRKRDILLVEDAAQGHGGTLEGRPLGSLGDRSVLSFGRGKGWTGGGGGALLLRDPVEAQALKAGLRPPRSLSMWAVRAAAQSLLGRPSLYGLVGTLPGVSLGRSIYHDPSPPRRLSRTAARLLLATDDVAVGEARTRRETAEALLERLPEGGAVQPVRPGRGGAGFLRLPVRVREPAPSWAEVARRLGIERSYPLALSDVPQLGSITAARRFHLPGSRTLAAELFTIPTHGRLTSADLDRIAAHLSRA